MNVKTVNHSRLLWAATLAVLFVALMAFAPRAEANSAAGAKILNTITVTYKDAGNITTYNANATSTVTVNLVRAALTYSGRPTAGSTGTSATLPSGQTVDSGATATYLIALTANANGGDTYNLSSALSNLTNVSGQTVTWNLMQRDGATTMGGANPANVALGASVIIANTSNTISLPGGSNLVGLIQTDAAGHKVLVVNGVDYLVSNVSAGNAASNTHVGNTYYNNLGTATAETVDVITLAQNPSGANVAPNFTAGNLVGQLAREQALVRVQVTANTGAAPGTNGTADFTITTTDGASGNSASTTAITTTWRAMNLQVRKTVRNCGNSAVGTCGATGFTATATGNPGDVLEYKVEVNNAGASAANTVSAQDAVPSYTTLITFTGAYGDGGTAGTGAATNNFATITDGTTTVPLTVQSSDTESGGASGVGAGDAAGTTAGSAIHFFLGTNATNAAGGSVAAGKTYTILYRMKIQ